MIVKICGITCLDDAFAALSAGADSLGFNFYPNSPRYISPTACRTIVREIRPLYPKAVLVGVFVNAPVEVVIAILETCGLDLAQLSGDEPPVDVQRLGHKAYKVFRPTSQSEAEALLSAYPLRRDPPACLVDAAKPGVYGGSGTLSNWEIARWLAQRAPILLAGGLTPENVRKAIEEVRPWGVDVASGVETVPGRKSPERLREFIRAAQPPIITNPAT